MSVPKFFEFFEPVLRSLADGNLHSSNDLRKFVSKDNLGVSVEHSYEVKRIDSDYFTEELQQYSYLSIQDLILN